MVYHEFLVERQAYKDTILFVFHTHVATVVFVTFVSFVIATKFSIAYFRVFNPTAQQKKFDNDLAYVKKWVPEYDSSDYPELMIDHAFARNRAIETYKTSLN